MSNYTAIKVENVSKKYCKTMKRSMFYGITDITRNALGFSSNSDRLRKDEFWSVENVSFEMKRGETLGLVGQNGSGKTTLLKMLNGIFWPDKGKITVKGRVGALIAVGAGFHPQLTGRENIYVNGAILGIGRREIEKKFDSIVDFADVRDFLDSPVKYYSSGMFVKLGFAIAVHCEIDVLLIDEVLSVGDISFQAKCIKRTKELLAQGVTVIFVSHNLNSVSLLCKKTLYLSKGRIKNFGETKTILDEYKTEVLLNSETNGNSDMFRYGTKEIEIKKVEFLDKHNNPNNIFKRGESFRVRIAFTAKTKIESPEFSVGFSTEDGVLLSKATTRDHSISIDSVNGDGEVNYIVESLPFNLGRYFITIGSWDSLGHFAYDHHERLYEIVIEGGAIDNRIRERFGYMHIPAKWEINNHT